MSRLTADFSAAFSRDLKKKAKRRNWDLNELQKLIDLVLENTPESTEILKRRHNMHRLSGSWAERNECHVANSGDWMVGWQDAIMTDFLGRGIGPTVGASRFPGAPLIRQPPIPGRIPWTANRTAWRPQLRISRSNPR